MAVSEKQRSLLGGLTRIAMKLPLKQGPAAYGDVLLIQAMNRDLEVPNVHNMRPQTVGSLHPDPTKSCKVAVVTLHVGPHGV